MPYDMCCVTCLAFNCLSSDALYLRFLLFYHAFGLLFRITVYKIDYESVRVCARACVYVCGRVGVWV
jgi:hypothetical protein